MDLAFNLRRNDTYRIASFEDRKQKDAYVDAEFHNTSCQEVWFRYQAARTLDERLELAQELDNTRWSFYKAWSKKYEPQKEPEIA